MNLDTNMELPQTEMIQCQHRILHSDTCTPEADAENNMKYYCQSTSEIFSSYLGIFKSCLTLSVAAPSKVSVVGTLASEAGLTIGPGGEETQVRTLVIVTGVPPHQGGVVPELMIYLDTGARLETISHLGGDTSTKLVLFPDRGSLRCSSGHPEHARLEHIH